MSTAKTSWEELLANFNREESVLREGGGAAGRERQKKLGRLTARDRISRLIDSPVEFLELNLWAAHEMYPDVGSVPAAGVVTGVGLVQGRPCMVVANDATVKAGAFFPQTAKKILRAQRIASDCKLPLIYLVDSSGVYLPMQDEIFPDEDDFGRIFRNNAVYSAQGLPQIAAILGNCIAGGAYLPVLCDKILMTEGSGLYLAGPALVKAAIGQEVSAEELGGAHTHAEISGTVDFVDPNDEACLDRIRSLVGMLPDSFRTQESPEELTRPMRAVEKIYELISPDGKGEYDMRDLLECVIDCDSMQEYKADYGKALVTVYARIGGHPVGIVGNQRMRTTTRKRGVQIGGVIYSESADKAARFVLDCNQNQMPLLFMQDVQGFMVGKDAEHSGIIRSGAKLVNAMSNVTVPKVTVIVGGSFGAGHYALCGKAFDPRFIFAWPHARYAVMGAEQASDTLVNLLQRNLDKGAGEEALAQLKSKVRADYLRQTDIRYGAARGWVDGILKPDRTRKTLAQLLRIFARKVELNPSRIGVMQT